MVIRTTKDLFGGTLTRDEPEVEQRLAEAVRAIREGRGTALDAELFFSELMFTTGYFYVAPSTVSDRELHQREGARSVFARILYLLDISMSELDEYRRAALAELKNTNDEGA